MKRRRWLWPVSLIAVALAVWGCDRSVVAYWVGATDLEIEFVVTNADGQPIEAAEISIQSEGGFYRESEEKGFKLLTDRNGVARRLCHGTMCFGTRSMLRFIDTFAVHLPWWHFQVVGPGYEPSNTKYLNTPEYQRQVHRLRPSGAKLVVPVSLERVK